MSERISGTLLNSVAVAGSTDGISHFSASALGPAQVLTLAAGFTLCHRCVDGEDHVRLLLQRVDSLLLKNDCDALVLQLPDVVHAFHHIPGKPTDGLHHHYIDFSIQTILDHAHELLAFLCPQTGKALVTIDPHQCHVRRVLDQTAIIAALGLEGQFLVFQKGAHPAVGRCALNSPLTGVGYWRFIVKGLHLDVIVGIWITRILRFPHW